MQSSRRTLLLGSTVVAAGLFGAIRSSRAFSSEEIPATSGPALAYSNRCGGGSDGGTHAAIMAQLMSALQGQVAAPGTMLSSQATCPVCGCPVVAAWTVR